MRSSTEIGAALSNVEQREPAHERRVHLARRRRKQRGAAFVESLIVIGMITLFLGSMSYFFYLYYGKWSAAQEARFNAWMSALDGCMDKSEYQQIFEDKKQGTGSDDEVAGLSSTDPSPPSWMDLELGGESTVTREVGDKKLTVARDVSCNEKKEEKELTFQGSGIIGAVAGSAVELLSF